MKKRTLVEKGCESARKPHPHSRRCLCFGLFTGVFSLLPTNVNGRKIAKNYDCPVSLFWFGFVVARSDPPRAHTNRVSSTVTQSAIRRQRGAWNKQNQKGEQEQVIGTVQGKSTS
jgi:hypothetical protein